MGRECGKLTILVEASCLEEYCSSIARAYPIADVIAYAASCGEEFVVFNPPPTHVCETKTVGAVFFCVLPIFSLVVSS